MVGRSLRISEGKTHAIILDHTDNYKRLGLPDREYDWSLDSRIRPPKFIPDNPVGNSLRGEREPREIEHLEGELVEIYSNSQELENTDMVKIRIDKVEYEATSSLADVICKILDRIDEVEDLLIEKEEELDAALGRADGYEEAIEEIAQELKQLRNDAKKIDALKLSITELTEKLKLAEAALEEKEEQLDAAVGRADGYEEAINEIIDELNQLREDAKAMADEDDEREKQLEAAIGRADGYEEAIKSISAELNQLRKEAKKMADDEEDEDIPKSKKKKGFVTFKKGEKMDSDTIAEVLQRPEVQEFIGEFLEDEIDSRLDAFARASELLEAYGISLEDAGITTRMDSITTIRTAITKLNPKNDISDRSDEYVINRFDTYCEIVAERVEYEKSISK
jgi:chromosome segregation ATPase